jgi:predicted phage tail protein
MPQMITLLTLRLASLEKVVMRLQHEGLQISGANGEGDASLRLIDDEILNSIATRLQNLEDSTFSEDPNNNTTYVNDGIVNDLNDKVASLQNELRDAQATISKLQLFTMDTNQKLLNVVMQQSVPSSFATTSQSLLAHTEEEVTVEDVNEDDEEDYNPTTNLKELIQRELENNDA